MKGEWLCIELERITELSIELSIELMTECGIEGAPERETAQ